MYRLLLILLLFSCGPGGRREVPPAHYMDFLRATLREQPEWIKVHAAEYLVWLGAADTARHVFMQEEAMFGNREKYRIGIWRVLAQTAETPQQKKVWTEKIQQAFKDSSGHDRVHAAESLAKLRLAPGNWHSAITAQAMDSTQKPLAVYTLWSTCYSSDISLRGAPEVMLALAERTGGDTLSRTLAAYAIRHLPALSNAQWQRLATMAETERYMAAKVYLLSAAFVHASPEDRKGTALFAYIHQTLLQYKRSPAKAARMEMAMALSIAGREEDLPALYDLYNNVYPLGDAAADTDVRATAAYAILKILGHGKAAG